MLSTEKVYMVIVKLSDVVLYYPAFGMVMSLKEGINFLEWFDGDRMRLTRIKNIISDKSNEFECTDEDSNSISVALLTKKLFEKYKNDLFMSIDLKEKDFKNDDELQKYLLSIK